MFYVYLYSLKFLLLIRIAIYHFLGLTFLNIYREQSKLRFLKICLKDYEYLYCNFFSCPYYFLLLFFHLLFSIHLRLPQEHPRLLQLHYFHHPLNYLDHYLDQQDHQDYFDYLDHCYFKVHFIIFLRVQEQIVYFLELIRIIQFQLKF